MIRRLWVLGCLVGFCLLPVQADACVSFGVILPEGTLFSTQARQWRQGVEVMITTLNAHGSCLDPVYLSASDRAETLAALTEINLPLIIGSGAPAVQETLLEASSEGAFVLWEVTEPLDQAHLWAFSPRPSSAQLGAAAAAYILAEMPDPRVALVYEERAEPIAEGLREAITPVIDRSYRTQNAGIPRIGAQVRDQDLNVLILAALRHDARAMWSQMRQADANVDLWIEIGGEDINQSRCISGGIIRAEAIGPINTDYRDKIELYTPYLEVYESFYQETPTLEADLAASGVYILATAVLPLIEGAYTPESVRAAIQSASFSAPIGLMGEGFQLDGAHNSAASVIIQQYQADGLCTLAPAHVATCQAPRERFRTWREHARACD
ncbi:MAG: ABC transporter substrate-binding protein [Anaerolineae bacterium]|jgi:hypothetical protein|nr:ABC transporter substrate-binding protein [Anaerolineae bacterium]